MHVVACLGSVSTITGAAEARGISLLPLSQAQGAAVRLARWSTGDGLLQDRPDAARRGSTAARAMLLVDDDEALAAGLDAGADDAARIDASPVEIVARLAALLRTTGDARLIAVGDVVIDRATRTVRRGAVTLDLLPREYALLLTLAEHAGSAVSREALLRHVWARSFDPGTNMVQVQISRLRAKLDAAGPPVLHTDRGRGYRLGDAISAARFR